MLSKQIGLGLCAGLLGLSACAHDNKSRERASVSTVTNEEVTDNRAEQGETRMHYTEVGNDTALGRDNKNNTQGTLVDPPQGTAGSQVAAAGTAADASACELAVYFDSNSATLDQSSQQRLDRVADCMKRREVDHAEIVGQTDPTGSKEHNQQLGLERARVVAEYLRGRGVPEDQIRVRSKGELAAAESQELWPVERRAGVGVKR
jgi:outer membrane protein OmpA-like peptidoglycan-associated protein